MPSYQHNQLLRRVEDVNAVPDDPSEYSDWVKGDGALNLLRENAREDELLVHNLSRYMFVETVVVSEKSLSAIDLKDLLDWNIVPGSLSAGYVWRLNSNDVRVDRSNDVINPLASDSTKLLVFSRRFEGFTGEDGAYLEVLQEYSHLTDIHWRPEQRAYSRFDELGEMQHVVSITRAEDSGVVSLVSFRREQLDQYLAATNSALIRLFDLTMFRKSEFRRWSGEPEEVFQSNELMYRQLLEDGRQGYIRGVQIIRPEGRKEDILAPIRSWSNQDRESEHCEFIAQDWRNRRITKISTHPSATTNYFEAEGNSLPYEISPVFFKPEVLLRYKSDREKYTVDEESLIISCRGGWSLRAFDFNEAGQVHTYIRYLGELPREEQLYWLGFNEEPKAGISERAIARDFEGDFSYDYTDPLGKVRAIVREWSASSVPWWQLRERGLLLQVNVPRTDSKLEWAQAFTDLAKLVVEGFQVRELRRRLTDMSVTFAREEQSIKLLERILSGLGIIDDDQRLEGLRTVQSIRSQVGAHASGSAADSWSYNAMVEYGSYSAHFEGICETVSDELTMMESALMPAPSGPE